MDFEKWGKQLRKIGLQLFLVLLIWQGYIYTIDLWGYQRALITLGFFSVLIISGNLSSIQKELEKMNKTREEKLEGKDGQRMVKS